MEQGLLVPIPDTHNRRRKHNLVVALHVLHVQPGHCNVTRIEVTTNPAEAGRVLTSDPRTIWVLEKQSAKRCERFPSVETWN